MSLPSGSQGQIPWEVPKLPRWTSRRWKQRSSPAPFASASRVEVGALQPLAFLSQQPLSLPGKSKEALKFA